jgi:thioredoxin-dependent peroxiredoxin
MAKTASAAVKKPKPTSSSKAAKPRATKPSATPDAMLGKKAPEFRLPIAGGMISSKNFSGKPYVLYFYPKDDTSGCTAEACAFRDALPDFSALGVALLGVSKDSLASHEKFAAKYNLNFPLASDTEGKLLQAFGVWIEKSMYGRKYMGIDRATFLIDAKGVIRAVWRKVSVTGHVQAVQQALQDMTK